MLFHKAFIKPLLMHHHQCPKHFAPLMQKVLLVQQQICCCHSPC